MKTSLCVLLLFLTFYSLGQDSLRFFENGKAGLKHRDGRIILEPKYTDLIIEANGIRLYDDGLQGYLPKGSTKIIPVEYEDISLNFQYFEAKKNGGTIDLYRGSELIAGDLDIGLQLTDILVETNLVIIRRDEQSGIIDPEGKIVVPVEYGAIEQLPCFEYRLNNSILVNYVLLLDKSDYFYSPELGGFLRFGEPVLYLAKADGILITEQTFSDISFDRELNKFSLTQGEKVIRMNQEFQMDK